mgnify:CR=1 FL=1
MLLENKKILILGFGKEGESTYLFLRKHFPEKKLEIVDKNMNLLTDKPYLLEDINVEVVLGEDYFRDIDYFDIVLKTPGISLKDFDISKFENKITSQLELLLEFVPCYTIGVTGTKGKSTTSSLIYQMIKEQGKDVMLLGNIGEPIFNDIDDMKKDTILVLELSSHALEFVKKSPNIAILLDIYEEHLDHYSSMEKYIEAKFNVAKFQSKNDIFIYNASNRYMQEFNFDYKKSDYAIIEEDSELSKTLNLKSDNYVLINEDRIYFNKTKLFDSKLNMQLKGKHNENNVLFVLTVAKILNLDMEKAKNTIENFKNLEHRMEFVAEINDVKYYNDSIATIPEATINAVDALKNVNTLVLGGMDRQIDYSNLEDFIIQDENLENLIFMPDTGTRIYKELQDKGNNKKCYLVNNLEEAVKKAKEVTKKNTICLLSPAAASYGFFKNFEERGNKYKELLKEL